MTNTMTQKEQQETIARRYVQLSDRELATVSKLIRDQLKDPELAIRVTLQLRNTEEYNRLRRAELENNNKSLAQRLRDIADRVSDLEHCCEYN